jgi:hypothetical protein
MRHGFLLAAAALAVASAAHAASTPASPKFAVPFIDDDYARAVKEARARNVPIFVENWAPW